ncbi:hypothetical protein OUZ56_018710 [Daphnia magna]|uniref:Uncharacterized protein n=1 Tax=Daphnia magna TaxID=35525 RepID=A0ABQ9Z9M0_9CRUS|nr:hypothetical protein OUZ56_018710 [Daphnia magna]
MLPKKPKFILFPCWALSYDAARRFVWFYCKVLELHKSLVADEKIHELLRFTISTNLKKDVEQPYRGRKPKRISPPLKREKTLSIT